MLHRLAASLRCRDSNAQLSDQRILPDVIVKSLRAQGKVEAIFVLAFWLRRDDSLTGHAFSFRWCRHSCLHRALVRQHAKNRLDEYIEPTPTRMSAPLNLR